MLQVISILESLEMYDAWGIPQKHFIEYQKCENIRARGGHVGWPLSSGLEGSGARLAWRNTAMYTNATEACSMDGACISDVRTMFSKFQSKLYLWIYQSREAIPSVPDRNRDGISGSSSGMSPKPSAIAHWIALSDVQTNQPNSTQKIS